MSLKRSLNEIELVSRKAARGYGFPWGVAEEVGKSVRWLHVYGINGVSVLAKVFNAFNPEQLQQSRPQSLGGEWAASAGLLNPILTGIALCDCMHILKNQPIRTAVISYPVLTMGFLGQTALDSEQSLCLRWQDLNLHFHRDQLAMEGNTEALMTEQCQLLHCQQMAIPSHLEVMPPHIGDVQVEAESWEPLEEYAFKTYVEATEASRLSGAGAGLNDND